MIKNQGIESVANVKIRAVSVIEYDANDLPDWLREAAAKSGKSVSAICREAGITTQYWYEVLRDRKNIRLETLEKIEASVGDRYPAPWRN